MTILGVIGIIVVSALLAYLSYWLDRHFFGED